MLELTAAVDAPAHGGSCVARVDGRVVFCRGALPGETVQVAIADPGEKQRFWRGETLAVLSPNPGRVPSPCPAFRPGGCGGCSWLHANTETQLAVKRDVLAQTLLRIGGVDVAPVVHDLGLATGWRTRLTMHTDHAGTAGFHAYRSRKVVAISDCLQADERLDLPEILSRNWPARTDVHVSVSDAGRAVVWKQDGARRVEGPATHRYEVHGRSFAAAVDGFWQSHKRAAEFLSGLVADWLADTERATIVDLYAGVGLFGLTLADRVQPREVLLVEGDRRAARFARHNSAGDSRLRVRGADVKTWAGSADVVVLDPPRAGAGDRVIGAIDASGASTVVYVSCEPSTLARDLAMFATHGFTVDRLEGADLFPGTAHVETVVKLVR